MNVFCNSEAFAIEHNATLNDFLISQSMDKKKGIAVAVNNTVVKRPEWNSFELNENDKILIISATKGG